MSEEQVFFAVFCVESIADELGTTGDKIYKILTEDCTILDDYIVQHYDALHTQGKDYIVNDIIELMKKKGVLQ
jgi:predicted transcriptional regulator